MLLFGMIYSLDLDNLNNQYTLSFAPLGRNYDNNSKWIN